MGHNVKELVQEIPQMEADGCIMAGTMNNRSKRIQYRYDLISGNVLQVDYQSELPDQFHHRYFYDADNRIDYVETSRNAIVWREDARYFYYPHGPLARVELGGNKVQGLDYAYTLQGWLKGINSDLLTPENDMGNDALVGTINEFIGRDVYGLSLGYYGQDDYAAIDDTRWLNTTALRPFAPEGGAMANTTDHQPLYNGNIAHTVNALAPFTGYPDSPTAPGQALAMVYRYDQLNRLMEARGYDGLDNTNLWANATASATDLFKSTYRYDANGNMERIERYDQHGDWYDELSYFYQNSGAHRVRNRLYHVTDSKDAADAYVNQTPDGFEDYPYNPPTTTPLPETPTDLNNLLGTINTANNYRYDALGNLVGDKLEHIENIDWTVTGKVRGVQHEDGNGDKDLLFSYGADGQRIVKEVQDDLGNFETRSYYIRDAQGNVMAHYTYDRVTGSFKVTERPMYGSSRLGLDNYTLELCGLDLNDYDPLNDPPGEQRYELTDHLSNVTTVVTDEVVGVNSDGVTGYEYFQPQVVSASGYEPFGGLLPGRNYTGESYRYGFNGQEKDNEVNGSSGTSYTAEFWQYDPRVARRWNLDPVFKPWQSSYSTFSNSPISRNDPKGDDDYFNADGTLNRRTETGHNIIVMTSEGDVKFGDMRADNMHNRQVMANIVGHYARTVGIFGVVGIGNAKLPARKATGVSIVAKAFTQGDEIYVNAKGGLVNESFTDYRNLRNSLVHERYHLERGEGYEDPSADPSFVSYRHATVYLAQMQHSTFEHVTNKDDVVGAAVFYLNESVKEMRENHDPREQLRGLIDEFNKLSDISGYQLTLTVKGYGSNSDSYDYLIEKTPVEQSNKKKP